MAGPEPVRRSRFAAQPTPVESSTQEQPDIHWREVPPALPDGAYGAAPYDGLPVWLRGLDHAGVPQIVEGAWRSTREVRVVDKDGTLLRQWVPIGYWAVWVGGKRLDFEPTGWHRHA